MGQKNGVNNKTGTTVSKYRGIETLSAKQCRAARHALGWSVAQLALRARVSHQTIRDYESGLRTPIRRNLEAIASVLTMNWVGLKLHVRSPLERPRASGRGRARPSTRLR